MYNFDMNYLLVFRCCPVLLDKITFYWKSWSSFFTKLQAWTYEKGPLGRAAEQMTRCCIWTAAYPRVLLDYFTIPLSYSRTERMDKQIQVLSYKKDCITSFGFSKMYVNVSDNDSLLYTLYLTAFSVNNQLIFVVIISITILNFQQL